MSEVHPTALAKPSKPSADFPLFPHATKRWAKKIKGKMHYFGPWDDPQAALQAFQDFIAGKPTAERPKAPLPPSTITKPAKPYPDFPLFPHATGRWAKKVRGRMCYFGKWNDPDGALAKYLAEKDDLHAGRTPRDAAESLTVFALCGKFLTTKKRMLDTGELSARSFADYAATCKLILKAFGKRRLVWDLRPDDFEKLRAAMAKTWGPVRLAGEVNRVRVVFNYGWKGGLLDKPMLYGEGFKRPSKKTLRSHRQAQGPKMFEADEVRRLLQAAGQPLRAMILLGVNCGFGNADVATLPLSALDLTGGWADYPRPKTAIPRRCPLWPETVAVLREWLAVRPEAKAEAGARRVFLTKYRQSWHTPLSGSPLSAEFRKLLDALGINGHRNFYALRHTFQTVADESGDFIAVRSVMGHATSDIADHYRERISDERLRRVAEYVRAWAFAEASTKAP